MHSSRMRTAACCPYLPACTARGGIPGPGSVPGPGGYLVPGGVPGPRGVYLVPGVYLVWGVYLGVYLVLGVYLPRGVYLVRVGVYLPRGVYLVLGGYLPRYSPHPVNRMTDRCKNITLPQTSFAAVTIFDELYCDPPSVTKSSSTGTCSY